METAQAAGAEALRQRGKMRFRLTPYGMFSLVLLAISAVSVIPNYVTVLFDNPADMSPQLMIHGAAFMAWYVLFSVQSGLISARRAALHKKLGYISILFASFLIVSGALMLLGTMSSYDPSWTERHLFMRASFVWAIFHTLVSFTIFYALAVMMRGRREAHKRFMLLASLSMMAASITRFAYLPGIPIDGTAFTLLFTYALLAAPLVMDHMRLGRVHPVLAYGVAIYAVTQIAAMAVLPATSFGRSLAFSL
ncbi:MAG: hypothetical protein MI723_18380 [Caulobacterales bacterium]|nr:hypothetical protein [Caulobacterales bacterium]